MSIPYPLPTGSASGPGQRELDLREKRFWNDSIKIPLAGNIPLYPVSPEGIAQAGKAAGNSCRACHICRVGCAPVQRESRRTAIDSARRTFDRCRALNATFCLPHQCVTDALVDRREETIRDLGIYTRMIRERGMIPGLSTHMPETVVYADKMEADVETYIQLYNAAGFLMQVEADWIMQTINRAHKPVITIKPLAAGRLLPVAGLAFVWNTIRDRDMVTIGTTTADEAREVIELSLDLISRRIPVYELQRTRSKQSLRQPLI